MLSYAEYLEEASRSDLTAYDNALHASTELAAAVRREFETMRRHRDTSGLSDRMMFCQRAVAGEYSSQQLAQIRQFGGSDAFARITGVKVRTAAALLSGIFLGPERPWSIEPTPEPTLPDDIHGAIKALALAEANGAGVQDAGAVKQRMEQLLEMANLAAKDQATKAAKRAETRLDDDLVEGQFYVALEEFLLYFVQFPIAVLKGPFFKSHRRVKYVEGMPTVVTEPMMFFSAPNPFDVWFAPGVSRSEDGAIVERIRLARSDIEALRGTPNYDEDAINAALNDYPNGHSEITSSIEHSRAETEERESPILNDTGLYDVLEFHGWMAGNTLVHEKLFENRDVDEDATHHVTVRMLDKYVISAHLNPDPMQRSIYDTAAFERVAGSLYGRALPEILSDIQSLANSALRAIINNMGLASGPQVAINLAAISENENAQEMYPWKRWFYQSDPAAPTAPPFMFFQPTDNSMSLINVYERAMQYADEVSAIPRYASGGERVGGAGSTASGLAMLMGNVSKVFGYTAAGIDTNILEPKLKYLYDMRLLTDTEGLFRGDETIRPRGSMFAAKAEIERTRALEFLQLTGNPIDMQILGPQGRALVLGEVAEHLGFDHNRIAEAMRNQAVAPAPVPGAPEPGQGQPGTPGNIPAPGPAGPPRVAEGLDNAQRTAGAGQTVG
jgi:hypothetical protein